MTLRAVPVNLAEDGDKKVAEVLIYEPIGADWFGEGLTAKGFADNLAAMGDVSEINVRINSPGGSVFDAMGIYSSLVRHPANVVVDIEGLAASAASFIAMAGDEIRMVENGMMMIHEAQGVTMGPAEAHLKTAEILEKHDGTIAATYAKRTGRKAETFLKLMKAETWFTAQEALENKLVTSIIPMKKQAAASVTWEQITAKYPNVPERLKELFPEEPPFGFALTSAKKDELVTVLVNPMNRGSFLVQPKDVELRENLGKFEYTIVARLRCIDIDEQLVGQNAIDAPATPA